MKSYSVNLISLENKRCIVIGGSAVAERKVAGLVAAGARPIVISPTISPGLADLLVTGYIEHQPRGYSPGDLEGVFLVIAATGDQELNQRIWEAAQDQCTLVNVVDAPQLCSFFTPSVVRRGDFVVSVSTGGSAPALAVHVRRDLETRFGREYEVMVAWCAALRPVVREAFPDLAERKARWYALVESPVLPLLVEGHKTEARALITEILGPQVTGFFPSSHPREDP